MGSNIRKSSVAYWLSGGTQSCRLGPNVVHFGVLSDTPQWRQRKCPGGGKSECF